MEENNENVIKRGRGRPPTYLTEEDRKDAIKKSKAKYMAKKREKNQKVERSRKRKPKYSTNEERKHAITKSKTKYMVNKKWCCNVCNGHNYILAGKHCHLKSMKHIREKLRHNAQIF